LHHSDAHSYTATHKYTYILMIILLCSIMHYKKQKKTNRCNLSDLYEQLLMIKIPRINNLVCAQEKQHETGFRLLSESKAKLWILHIVGLIMCNNLFVRINVLPKDQVSLGTVHISFKSLMFLFVLEKESQNFRSKTSVINLRRVNLNEN